MNYLRHTENISIIDCNKPQYLNKFDDFTYCFAFHARKNVLNTLFGIILFILILFTNCFLIVLILKKKKFSLFCEITIGHCILNLITGLIDLPLFHIYSLFGYWSIGRILSLIWIAYDNSINTNTTLHMIYMAYVTMRSLKSPVGFKKELLIRRPRIVMLLLWIISLSIWITITLIFDTKEFEPIINYRSLFYLQFVFNFIFWFMAHIVLLLITIILVYNLKILKKNKILFQNINISIVNKIRKVGKIEQRNGIILRINSHFCPETRILFIILTFWIQWIIPCCLVSIQSLCNCLPNQLMINIYWLTFTVCFTDPFFIYLLNPSFNSRK